MDTTITIRMSSAQRAKVEAQLEHGMSFALWVRQAIALKLQPYDMGADIQDEKPEA